MSINRREFIQNSACISATSAIAASPKSTPSTRRGRVAIVEKPLFIATWPFGKFSCEAAVKIATNSGSMLDAIEKGIWVTENDVKNASVGIGGIPNANGQVELGACIMSGPDHNAGSVAGIQDILHPISVARLVMESTPHVMLVGEGAKQFAIEKGHPETNLLTNQHVVGYSSQVDVVITDVETFSGEVVTIDVQKDIAIVKICCSGEFSSITF